jgi:hypothetical protein
MALRTSDGWEVKKTRKVKKTKNNRPEEGSYVLLKTLEEVYKLHGVGYWDEIYDPEIAEEMISLFGDRVRIVYSRGYREIFEAEDVTTGDVWHFRNEWIERKEFEMELIPDELFEI